MSTTSLTVAAVVYLLLTFVIIAFFVKDANVAEKRMHSAHARLAKCYQHSATLEERLADRTRLLAAANQQLSTLSKWRPGDGEPPEGSIVALDGEAAWTRNGLPEAPWSNGFDDLEWSDLESSDLRILRWSWGR